MLKSKNKKAITTKMIIIFIILIVSFAVILFLWRQFNWREEISQDTCHTSLVLRHTANIKNTFQFVPVELRCETGKVCFVKSSGENCGSAFSSGEKVEKIVIKSKTDLGKALSDLSYTCWDMLGRGFLEYQPLSFKLTEKNYCAPCYRLAFSPELQADSQITGYSYDDLFIYMQDNPIPDTSMKMNYYEFLSGGSNYYTAKTSAYSGKESAMAYHLRDPISFDKQYMIVTIMTKQGAWKVATGAVFGAALVFVTGGSGLLVYTALAATGAGIGYYNTDTNSKFSVSQILPYSPEVFSELKCDTIDFIT